MMVSIDFDTLITFDCTYGQWEVDGDRLRIFVEKGLIFPHCKFVKYMDDVSIVGCKADEGEPVEDMFPLHYIYDPAKKVEYVEWELVDGLLRGRRIDGQWTQYTSRSESSHAMHEYVGGCWFVFESVSFSKKMVVEYAADHQGFTGRESIDESGSKLSIANSSAIYFLEGVLSVPPGPGWMSWEIHAASFHLDIPEGNAA